jgi:hypothetical protein
MGLGSEIRKNPFPRSRIKKTPDPGFGYTTLSGSVVAVEKGGVGGVLFTGGFNFVDNCDSQNVRNCTVFAHLH